MNKKHVFVAGLLSTVFHVAFIQLLLTFSPPRQEENLAKLFIDAHLISIESEHLNPEKKTLEPVVEATQKTPDSTTIKDLLAHEPPLVVGIELDLTTDVVSEDLVEEGAFLELAPKSRGGSPFTRHLRRQSQPMPPLMRPLTTEPQTLVCAEEIDDMCDPAKNLSGAHRH
jgi:hypothetical protein